MFEFTLALSVHRHLTTSPHDHVCWDVKMCPDSEWLEQYQCAKTNSYLACANRDVTAMCNCEIVFPTLHTQVPFPVVPSKQVPCQLHALPNQLGQAKKIHRNFLLHWRRRNITKQKHFLMTLKKDSKGSYCDQLNTNQIKITVQGVFTESETCWLKDWRYTEVQWGYFQ